MRTRRCRRITYGHQTERKPTTYEATSTVSALFQELLNLSLFLYSISWILSHFKNYLSLLK